MRVMMGSDVWLGVGARARVLRTIGGGDACGGTVCRDQG